MILEILVGNALHAVDFNFNVSPGGQRIGHLVNSLFVHLHAMYGQSGTRVQLFVANVTLEVFRLLVLNQNLFVVELAVTVPTPRFTLLLLLPPHDGLDVVWPREQATKSHGPCLVFPTIFSTFR